LVEGVFVATLGSRGIAHGDPCRLASEPIWQGYFWVPDKVDLSEVHWHPREISISDHAIKRGKQDVSMG
jgi:hypothetical protein